MIAYASRTGTRRNLAALRDAGWRILVSARGVLRNEGFRYALDNGAWTAFTQGEPFDVAAFEKALDLMGAEADWVASPDIVGGGMRSLELSESWLPRLIDARLVLIPVQDGLTASDVQAWKAGGYRPRGLYEANADLRAVIDFIGSGALSGGDTALFRPIVEQLLGDDPYMLMADYAAYVAAQDAVSARWRDPDQWTREAVLNVARMGRFSSDRSILEYCERIWNVTPGRQ